jgi:DNA-binding CsgD family transcriptional regulator
MPLVPLILAITSLAVRYRRGDEILRRQVLWLVFASILAVGLNLPRWIVGYAPILLLLAITTVAAGGVIFGPAVARRVLAHFAAPTGRGGEPFPELTPRERGVLDLIAAGLPNAAIASRLGLAGKTVGNHISSIFLKLQVATRAEAITRARQAGLGGG